MIGNSTVKDHLGIFSPGIEKDADISLLQILRQEDVLLIHNIEGHPDMSLVIDY